VSDWIGQMRATTAQRPHAACFDVDTGEPIRARDKLSQPNALLAHLTCDVTTGSRRIRGRSACFAATKILCPTPCGSL